MVKANCDREAIFAVAANNVHLYNEQQVSNSDGKAFADEIGAIFQCISPMSDSGISTLFDNIGKTYLIPGYNYQELDKKAEEEFIKRKMEKMKEKKKKKEGNKTDNKKTNCLLI